MQRANGVFVREYWKAIVCAFQFRSGPDEKARLVAGKLEEEWRGPGAFAIALGGIGKAKDPPGARDADIGDPALFLDIVRIGVRQNAILHPGQKHRVPFEPFGGMDGRKHNGMRGWIALRFGLLLDLCVQFLQAAAG